MGDSTFLLYLLGLVKARQPLMRSEAGGYQSISLGDGMRTEPFANLNVTDESRPANQNA